MAILSRTLVGLSAWSSIASALYINGSVTAPCDSPLYCQGDIIRQIELARPFSDSKTFVDLPTIRPLSEVIAAFNNLTQPISNNTELQTFLTTYFGKAGSELAPVPASQLQTNPTFLNHVNDTGIADFVRQVIGIWPDLTRQYVGSNNNCTECVDSFLNVNRTFVVAGGRFREPYYWDSFWIVEGLLRTQGSFTQIARNIIENFLDFVEQFGFVPNGARVYYLNRSQPPLLTQMVSVYVQYTNDTSLLQRALPLLIREHQFWMTNQTVTIQSGNTSYSLNHYSVQNNQPRPESYREDYVTANNHSYYAAGGIIYPEAKPLNETAKATLYQNLASGAESGWDYSSRWIANPSDAVNDVYFPLRSLNTVKIVPVDLNSILYYNEVTIAGFLNQTGNSTGSQQWLKLAAQRSQAMYQLMWNESHFSYFDYNMTSGGQNVYILADKDATAAETSGAPAGYQVAFSPAQYYPFWTGAAPRAIKNNPLAVRLVYGRVADLLNRRAGVIAATNLATGQQWDQPNVWPPLQYILIKGLMNTPATFGSDDPDYVWTQQVALELAQRYVDSTYCTWRVTGGSSAEAPKLASAQGNGTIFEKYAENSTNAAGGGGEYTVVEGFGWSNGALIWIADKFGANLTRPQCGNITAANIITKRSTAQSAVELDKRDATWVVNFKQ
ncbi:hypothetical protein LTR04_001166 [Oleoguttula sp. CCFEE 6159]|nr:hypothetical protein LTR04_001166 [Oleoguttula sp. CCFEE 6159]